jgi:DNA-binding NarL/FixJ family response regulator
LSDVGLTRANSPGAGRTPQNGGISRTIRVMVADSQAIFAHGIRQILSKAPNARFRFMDEADSISRLELVLDRQDVYTGLIKERAVTYYRAGVRGLVDRDMTDETLPRVVQRVAEGTEWIDRRAQVWLLHALREPATPGSGDPTVSVLSRKERTIISLLIAGKRNKEIANILDTTEQVIKNCLRAVYKKLGVNDRLDLILTLMGRKQGTPPLLLAIGPLIEQLALKQQSTSSMP